MALLTVQDASGGLASLTRVAATGGGDTIPAGGNSAGWSLGTALLVVNTDAATKTVTVEGMAPVVVPATTGMAVIPIPYKGFGATRTITYSAVVGVTVGAFRIGAGS
jgi:hypothetical protein